MTANDPLIRLDPMPVGYRVRFETSWHLGGWNIARELFVLPSQLIDAGEDGRRRPLQLALMSRSHFLVVG